MEFLLLLVWLPERKQIHQEMQRESREQERKKVNSCFFITSSTPKKHWKPSKRCRCLTYPVFCRSGGASTPNNSFALSTASSKLRQVGSPVRAPRCSRTCRHDRCAAGSSTRSRSHSRRHLSFLRAPERCPSQSLLKKEQKE